MNVRASISQLHKDVLDEICKSLLSGDATRIYTGKCIYNRKEASHLTYLVYSFCSNLAMVVS